MRASAKPPSIRETAFSCPHCYAFTTQYWYNIYAKAVSADTRIPLVPTEKQKQGIENNAELSREEKQHIIEWIDKIQTGLVFFESGSGKYGEYPRLENLHISECYNCRNLRCGFMIDCFFR